MRLRARVGFATAIVASLIVTGQRVSAAALDWTVDSTASSYTFTVGTQQVLLTSGTQVGQTAGTIISSQTSNAGTWTSGNSAAIGGTLSTDYVDGLSIEFIGGQTNLVGVASKSLRPNPTSYTGGVTNPDGTASGGSFSDTTTTSAVYGFKLRMGPVISTDAGYFALRDVHYDISSALLSVGGGGSFTLDNAATAGLASALVGQDGVNNNAVGLAFPDSIFQHGSIVTLEHSSGTITSPDPINQPLLRKLTLPLAIQNITLNLGNGSTMTGTASGMLVATAIVPEPSTMALAGSGLAAGIAFFVRSRRARRG